MKHKIFKIGDRIWCKEYGVYVSTDYHIPCIVVSIISPLTNTKRWDEDDIRVKIEDENTPNWAVNSRYFEHIPVINWRKRLENEN